MNNMRKLRKACGLTMKELGRSVGVAESTISLYETGKHEPDIQTMLRIAAALGVSVDELLGLWYFAVFCGMSADWYCSSKVALHGQEWRSTTDTTTDILNAVNPCATKKTAPRSGTVVWL